MKEIRGCEKDVKPYVIEGITLNRCPLITLGRKYDHYIRAYSFYVNGFFPNAGGWADQPNAVIEAIQHIDTEFNRMKDNGKQ